MPRISTRALSGGLGSLAQAIAGGQWTFDQAAEQGAIGQSKISQAIAAMRDHEAGAKLKEAQTADVNAGLEMQKPENVLRNAMLGSGIPLDEEGAVSSFLQSGNLGGKYTTPADGMGPVAPEPEWRGKLGGISRAIANTKTALTLGDKNSENVAKANQMGVDADLEQQVRDKKLDPIALAISKMAGKGEKPYNFNEYGVGNNYTGAVDSSSPVAQRFGAYRDSETDKNVKQGKASVASAANSYASADMHKASASKTRQDLEFGAKGTIQQTDQGMVLVDPRTGVARPVMGTDGKPLQGKGGNLNEGQANALTFANRMQASQDILDQMAKKGVFRGSLLKQGAEEVPLVGGALGMAANTMASPEQQQVEQAQRDFINAVLRRESGAAISMGEFSNAQKQYFDQPGDSRAVKDQKRASRQRVINGMLEAVPANMRSNLSKQAVPQGSWGPNATPSGATVSNW